MSAAQASAWCMVMCATAASVHSSLTLMARAHSTQVSCLCLIKQHLGLGSKIEFKDKMQQHTLQV
jgi:hypothetical protein